MSTLYTSNDAAIGFDADAAGATPPDWTVISGAWLVGTTAPGNGHSHSFGDTTGTDGEVALAAGISSAADMDVVCQQPISGNSTSSLILRSDSGYNNAYIFLVDPSVPNLTCYRRNGGSYSPIGNVAYSVANGVTRIMLRGQAQGSALRLRVWAAGTPEPTAWALTCTDGSVTASGYPGIFAVKGGVPFTDLVVSSLAASSITVDTPSGGPYAAGAAISLTGTYAGTAPTGVGVAFDGAGTYAAATGFAAASGSWSATIAAPSPSSTGLHWLTVQETGATTSTAATGTFTVSAAAGAAGISVSTPTGVTAGMAMTVSGTYTGTAPTGLNYEIDATGYTAAISPTIGGGGFSFSITAPAAGSHTVSVQEANATGVTSTSGSFTSSASSTSVAPNNAAIVYSPGNWSTGASSGITINAGAELRTMFSGGSCTLNFNVANNAAPLSQIWYRIDGEGPWTMAPVASTVACTIPAATAGNADVPYHLLEVRVKSTTETQNRWNAPSATAVVFTGLTLAAGAAVVAPGSAPLSMLVFGDSITEGVRTLGESAANDTDRNDASLGWAYRLGALLGADVGVVGFGGSGLSVVGSGNVPVLGTSYSQLFAGVARSFTPAPSLIAINIGTNDGSNATTAAMTGVLNGLLTACPGVPIAVLRPFNGSQTGNLQAAIAACGTPAAVHWIDTTGMFDPTKGADSPSIHPSGPNNLGLIAPALAAQLRPLLSGSKPAAFHGGFQRGLLG